MATMIQERGHVRRATGGGGLRRSASLRFSRGRLLSSPLQLQTGPNFGGDSARLSNPSGNCNRTKSTRRASWVVSSLLLMTCVMGWPSQASAAGKLESMKALLRSLEGLQVALAMTVDADASVVDLDAGVTDAR